MGEVKVCVWRCRSTGRPPALQRECGPFCSGGPPTSPPSLPSFSVVCTEACGHLGLAFPVFTGYSAHLWPPDCSAGTKPSCWGLGVFLSWKFQCYSSQTGTKQPRVGAEGPTPHWPRCFPLPTGRQLVGLPSCELYSSAVLWDFPRTG